MTIDTVASVGLDGLLPKSVFEDISLQAFKFRFRGTLALRQILGGIPSDPRVVEGWLKTKLGVPKETQIAGAVAEIMEKRGIDQAAAAEELAKNKSLNGFLRAPCPDCPGALSRCDKPDAHQLYVEGRCLKAAIKEATSVAVGADRLALRGWGKTNKGAHSWVAEHVMVVEDVLLLKRQDGSPVTSPDRVLQNFVSTRFGSAVQYQEWVDLPLLDFTVITDHDFSREQWGHIWAGGQQLGLGSSRSQGYGRYRVVRWEQF